MKKVVKFGGSSLASAEQFTKVKDIICSDSDRRYVVPSAPGKRFSGDTKVTDMLYTCYAAAEQDEDFSDKLAKIQARYNEIINGLGLTLSLDTQFEEIASKFAAKAGKEYAASRGEYLNGIIMANYLGYEFVDAAEVIRFNHHYQKDVFVLPSPVLPKQGAKITSLSNPLKKMSKSESDKGTIYLLEDIQIARKKIMSAVTDSENEIRYDMENKPGISNLLTILSVLTHQSIDDLQQKYQNVGYGQFKKDVADVVCHELETLQQKVQEIKNGHILESILKQGASKASSIASQTLQHVYEVIGIK